MQLADKIDHVVVVMMENRSFDNLLGLLPHPDPSFRRPPAGWSNPRSVGALRPPIELRETDRDVNGGGPGHHHRSALRQLTGPWTDAQWARFEPHPWRALGPQWDALVAESRTNQGFYWDYSTDKKHRKRPYKRVMRMWGRDDIPALWALALEYGVCQRWFCSLPGQTQPNRHFAMCGTSFGHVNNGKPVRIARRESSAFVRVDSKFYGDLTSLTPFICRDVWTRNHSRKSFYRAARNGGLPKLSFIEPNNLPRSQSQHAGFSEGPECMWRGDALIARVYNALRSNWAQWQRTLLIITWDEHGGFPDHEPPPRRDEFSVDAEPDGDSKGFDFTLLGPRVPAIVASPWIKKGLLDDEVRDHTTILSTLRQAFPEFGADLGARAAVMPHLGNVLADEIVGDETRLPEVPERVDPPIFFRLEEEDADEPVDDYQLELVKAMIDVAHEEGLDLGISKPVEDVTVADAIAMSRQLGPIVGADGAEIDAE